MRFPIRRSPRPAARLRWSVAVVLCLGFLGACSDGSGVDDADSSGSAEATTAAEVELPTLDDSDFVDRTGETALDVDVIDNSYDERYVTVSVGTTITWTNNGETEHNVTPSTPGQFEGVDSDGFAPGATHQATFTEVGEYQYYCTIHATPRNGQTGAVRVVA